MMAVESKRPLDLSPLASAVKPSSNGGSCRVWSCFQLSKCVSHPPKEMVTNFTPASTSRDANRQLIPKGVLPNGAAYDGVSLLTSNAVRARRDVIIS